MLPSFNHVLTRYEILSAPFPPPSPFQYILELPLQLFYQSESELVSSYNFYLDLDIFRVEKKYTFHSCDKMLLIYFKTTF